MAGGGVCRRRQRGRYRVGAVPCAAPALRAACSAELLAGAAGVTPVFVELSELVAAVPGLFDMPVLNAGDGFVVADGVDPAAPELRAACAALFDAGAVPLPVAPDVPIPEPAAVPPAAVPVPDDAAPDAAELPAPEPPLPPPEPPPPPPPPPPWAKAGAAPARSAATMIAIFEAMAFSFDGRRSRPEICHWFRVRRAICRMG
jgi:hypothetical protein